LSLAIRLRIEKNLEAYGKRELKVRNETMVAANLY
jgi:hypothetical protein